MQLEFTKTLNYLFAVVLICLNHFQSHVIFYSRKYADVNDKYLIYVFFSFQGPEMSKEYDPYESYVYLYIISL